MAASNSPRRTSLRSTTSKPLAFKASRAAAAAAAHRASGGRLAYWALEMIRAVRSGWDGAGLVFQQRPAKPSRTVTRQARIRRNPPVRQELSDIAQLVQSVSPVPGAKAIERGPTARKVAGIFPRQCDFAHCRKPSAAKAQSVQGTDCASCNAHPRCARIPSDGTARGSVWWDSALGDIARLD